MKGTRYCLCCNEEVPVNIFDREDSKEITCVYCGFTVEIQKLTDKEKIFREGYALVADDSKYTRKIIEDLIKEKRYSARVVTVENGQELISAYSRLLVEGNRISMAIIDLNMPVMDGLTAARTIRTLEMQKKIDRVPIVFFSGQKADEALKSQMKALEPAYYMNKGNDPDPDCLAERAERLLEYLLEKHGR
jgi:CheY-like chemotaxis protein